MRLLEKKYAVLSVLLLLFTGCTSTQYKYIPPATEAGLNCVAQCQQYKNVCMNNEQIHAMAAYQECEAVSAVEYDKCLLDSDMDLHECNKTAKRDYKHCLKHNKDHSKCREKKCRRTHCYKNTCFKTGNYSMCKNNFRECYQQCGGIVEIIETN